MSFASQRLQFDEMFPIEVKFEEAYSLIDMHVEGVKSVDSGEVMSCK